MKNRKFINLFIFYSLYCWFISFGTAILPIHFLHQGINLPQMIFGRLLLFITVFFLILALRQFSSRKSWQLACLFNFSYILLAYKIESSLQFYFIHTLTGAALFFFFVFYNIAHFKNAPKEKIGFASALMFSIGPIIGIFAPLLAGYAFEFKLWLLWTLAFIFFIVAIYFAGRQKDFVLNFNLKHALFEIRATRWFIFLQGTWEALIFGIIPIFTLYFIKTPVSYGAFLAYLALISVCANILLGKLTDKIQKRVVFLYPLTISMAIITFLFYFAVKDIYLWIIISGLIQFLVPLFYNISTAMVVDAHLNLEQAMPAREIVLSAGRIIGLSAVAISFYLEKIPQNIFFFLGVIILLYPVILFYNRKNKRYKYI